MKILYYENEAVILLYGLSSAVPILEIMSLNGESLLFEMIRLG
jgi:hypothetical protein